MTIARSVPATGSSRTLKRFLERSTLAGAVVTALFVGTAAGQTPPATRPAEGTKTFEMPPVTVVGERSDSLIGIAQTANEGTVGKEQLERRPLLRPGEVLETVPGLVITQHSGAGKANQFFLRGFNLDHGTDLATNVAGLPINLPTHAHGQGYTDLNFLIPELVNTVDYRKGPYFADRGDFASAGSVDIQYVNTLDQGIALFEGGSFGYGRVLFAKSDRFLDGNLLYAVEVFHDDGPWDRPDAYRKINGVLRYSQGNADTGFTLTALGYHGDWAATDQIPERAVGRGIIDRLGTLDPTTGGNSQRYALIADFHGRSQTTRTNLVGYLQYYDLDLFSNFTYFLADPVNGDQFEQQDRRVMGGVDLRHGWDAELFGKESEWAVGLQARSDGISNGLYNTASRQRLNTVRQDDVIETSFSLWAENRTKWADKLRTVVGIRGDVFNFDVDSNLPANSGNDTSAIASPKGSMIFGPWYDTEIYLSGGLGFHSNDARGITARVDPASGDRVSGADPLVRTKGAEIGIRTTAVKGLQSAVSFWLLDSDSELLFVGDAGNTEASRPSRRYGVEVANYYSPTSWLTFDADFSWSHARFTDSDPAGDFIPGSIETVVAAGVTIHDERDKWYASLRCRYFGPRPLIEDDSVRSGSTTLLNFDAGYKFNKNVGIKFEILNLLDTKAHDIDYFYPSRLAGEGVGPDDGGFNDTHFHPVYPLAARVALVFRF